MIFRRTLTIIFFEAASALVIASCAASGAHRAAAGSPQAISSRVDSVAMSAMKAVASQGLALAIVEQGRVSYVHTYGVRNATGEPLEADTVMYAASLTKVTNCCGTWRCFVRI